MAVPFLSSRSAVSAWIWIGWSLSEGRARARAGSRVQQPASSRAERLVVFITSSDGGKQADGAFFQIGIHAACSGDALGAVNLHGQIGMGVVGIGQVGKVFGGKQERPAPGIGTLYPDLVEQVDDLSVGAGFTALAGDMPGVLGAAVQQQVGQGHQAGVGLLDVIDTGSRKFIMQLALLIELGGVAVGHVNVYGMTVAVAVP